MREMRFSLDFNSPAFLSSTPQGTRFVEYWKGGQLKSEQVAYFRADPRGIRIPSLRGVLEFWYRALLGDASSSKEVFQKQAGVFGSADGGQGLTIRPVGMPRFEETDKGELSFDERDEPPYPYLYLGYGPLQLLRPPHNRQVVTSYHSKQAREAIFEGVKQRSRFQFMARGTPAQIEALKRALTLLHLFGGLGSRSRRGWGSVEVEAKAEGIVPPPSNAKLPEWIKTVLASVWDKSMDSGSRSQPEFSAFNHGARIYVTRELGGDFREVLKEFYNRFREVRSYRSQGRVNLGVKDHAIETKDHGLPADQAITEVPSRLAFGMPYQPGHGDTWSMEYVGRFSPDSERKGREVTRRASPLFLKVIRLAPNKHAGVALFLPAQFFWDRELEIGAKTKDRTRPFPGYGAIDTFLSGSGWTQVPLP